MQKLLSQWHWCGLLQTEATCSALCSPAHAWEWPLSVCRTLGRLWCSKKRPGQASRDLYSGPHRASYQLCDFRGLTCSQGLTVPGCEMRRSNLICLGVPSSSLFSTTSKALGHPYLPYYSPLSFLFLPFLSFLSVGQHIHPTMCQTLWQELETQGKQNKDQKKVTQVFADLLT